MKLARYFGIAIAAAGLALAAYADTVVFTSYFGLSGALPEGTTKYFTVDVSADTVHATKYLKLVKDSGIDGGSGGLSVYEADNLDGVRASTMASVNLVGMWAYNPSSETWTIVLSGSSSYGAIASLTEIVEQPDVETQVSVSIDPVVYGGDAVIELSVTPAGAEGEIVVSLNGQTYRTTADDPKLTVPTLANPENLDDARNLNAGHYLVRAEYKGNDEYKPSEAVQMLTVAKVQPSISIGVDKVYLEGDVAAICFSLTGLSHATNDCIVVIDGETTCYDDEKRIVRSFAPGEHCITAIYPGDRNTEYYATFTTFKYKPAFGDGEITVGVSDASTNEHVQATVYTKNIYGNLRDVALTVKNSAGEAVREAAAQFGSFDSSVGYATAIADLGAFEAGEYTVEAYYFVGGDSGAPRGYEAARAFRVINANTSLAIGVPQNLTVGEMAKIELDLEPAGATGEINVYVDGARYTTTAANPSVTVPPLGAGSHLVYARYEGDGRNASVEAQETLVVSKAETKLVLDCKAACAEGDALIVGVELEGACNPTGEVAVVVDDESYAAKAEEGWAMTIPAKPVGKHIISAYYPGDANNKAAFASSAYEVVPSRRVASGLVSSKIKTAGAALAKTEEPSQPVLGIKPIDPVVAGGDATIELEMLAEDATGKVLVVVNGVVYTNDTEHLTLVVPTTNSMGMAWLDAGGYLVTAEYEGDGNYAPAKAYEVLSVVKDKPSIDVDFGVSNGVFVADIGVTATFGINAIGALNAWVDGKVYPITSNKQIVIEILEPGHHTLIVSCPAWHNAEWAMLPVFFEMPANGMRVDASDVYVGERAEVTVSIPGADIIGDVVDKSFGLYVKDSGGDYVYKNDALASVHDDAADLWHATSSLGLLDEGKYTVEAVFCSSTATGTFNVLKRPTSLVITAPANMSAGDDANVLVSLSPAEATGDIAVYVDGTKYTLDAPTGHVAVPGVAAGCHTVRAVYAGDSEYAAANAIETFVVGRIPTSISVAVSNSVATAGEMQTIAISVNPAVTTEAMTVMVNNEAYSVNIKDGKGELSLPTQSAGKCVVTAFFSEDDAFEASIDMLSFKVKEKTAVSNVVARQRWPWNGLVDVDYEIGGDPDDLSSLVAEISFEEQGGEGRHWVATNFLAGAEPALNHGHNRATWDAKAAGVTNVIATNVIAIVSLLRMSIVDIASGMYADAFSEVDFTTPNESNYFINEDTLEAYRVPTENSKGDVQTIASLLKDVFGRNDLSAYSGFKYANGNLSLYKSFTHLQGTDDTVSTETFEKAFAVTSAMADTDFKQFAGLREDVQDYINNGGSYDKLTFKYKSDGTATLTQSINIDKTKSLNTGDLTIANQEEAILSMLAKFNSGYTIGNSNASDISYKDIAEVAGSTADQVNSNSRVFTQDEINAAIAIKTAIDNLYETIDQADKNTANPDSFKLVSISGDDGLIIKYTSTETEERSFPEASSTRSATYKRVADAVLTANDYTNGYVINGSAPAYVFKNKDMYGKSYYVENDNLKKTFKGDVEKTVNFLKAVYPDETRNITFDSSAEYTMKIEQNGTIKLSHNGLEE